MRVRQHLGLIRRLLITPTGDRLNSPTLAWALRNRKVAGQVLFKSGPRSRGWFAKPASYSDFCKKSNVTAKTAKEGRDLRGLRSNQHLM